MVKATEHLRRRSWTRQSQHSIQSGKLTV